MAATAPRARTAWFAPKLAAPLPLADGDEGPLVVVLLVELELFDEELVEDAVVEPEVAVLELWADDWEDTTED